MSGDLTVDSVRQVELAVLVLGDGFLELVELLAAGVRRQEAMTVSYNHVIEHGVVTLGLDPRTLPPEGYRHGTECINGLANDFHRSVMVALAGHLPPLSPDQLVPVTVRLLHALCWQVEAMRHHVVYGMPLGVAAQLGLDVAAGRRQPGSRKGHNKTGLDLATVLSEVRSTRQSVAAIWRLPSLSAGGATL